ncbi:PaaI family thioesterase [Georgenia muralis]
MTVHDIIEGLRDSGGDALGTKLGIEVLEASAGRVVARMPVAGNTQPYGLLHGGASAALAETVGSLAAAIHAGTDRVAVGTELSATHHRGVRTGWVTATTEALHEGRTTASYAVTIDDDDGRRVCTARLSCLVLPNS